MNVLRSCILKTTKRCFATASTSVSATPATSSASSAISSAVNKLRTEPAHYVVAALMGKRYLLAPRDLLTVPRLKTASIGDRLLFSHVHEVGSRSFTIRGGDNGASPLPPGVVRVEATVVEHTKGAMERIVKFKRRKHYRKTITHKQPYTRLRIGRICFGSNEVIERAAPMIQWGISSTR